MSLKSTPHVVTSWKKNKPSYYNEFLKNMPSHCNELKKIHTHVVIGLTQLLPLTNLWQDCIARHKSLMTEYVGLIVTSLGYLTYDLELVAWTWMEEGQPLDFDLSLMHCVKLMKITIFIALGQIDENTYPYCFGSHRWNSYLYCIGSYWWKSLSLLHWVKLMTIPIFIALDQIDKNPYPYCIGWNW